MRRSAAALAIGVAMAAAGAWTVAAGALAEARMVRKVPSAPVIAVVDLDRVLEGLSEAEARRKDLEALRDELQAEIDEIQSRVENERSKLEVATDAERQSLARRVDKLNLQLEVEVRYSEAVLAREEARMLADLYEQIVDGSARLAEQNDYTMVLTSDEQVQMPRENPKDLRNAVMLRRMLYVSDSMDITDELITFMNNQFAANP